MKYIDAEKLYKQVDELMAHFTELEKEAKLASSILYQGKKEMCSELLGIINSLQQEQPEVDLEKALNGLDNAYFDLDGIAVMGATYYLTVNDLKDIARDFYELGLKARKGEQEQQEVNLEEFTEKMDAWKARFNHPDDIPIKATMAFTARMFYQYPDVARLWYEQLPKATMD